jgi:MFS superfamily sulfate permease-like transporter
MKQTQIKILTLNDTKSLFFAKINNMDKPLAKLTKKRTEKIPINKIRDEKMEFTISANEIQRIIRECFESKYSNKLENLEEMDTSL